MSVELATIALIKKFLYQSPNTAKTFYSPIMTNDIYMVCCVIFFPINLAYVILKSFLTLADYGPKVQHS